MVNFSSVKQLSRITIRKTQTQANMVFTQTYSDSKNFKVFEKSLENNWLPLFNRWVLIEEISTRI